MGQLDDYGKTIDSDDDKQNWQKVKTSWAQYSEVPPAVYANQPC